MKAYKRHGSLDTFSSGALSTGQCLKIEKIDGSGSMDVSETNIFIGEGPQCLHHQGQVTQGSEDGGTTVL